MSPESQSQQPSSSNTLDRVSIAYAACYCEENIWQLSRDPQLPSGIRYVAFMSNEARRCALWAQRSAPEPGSPVIWDYHVALIVEGRETWVFDLDTVAGFPISLRDYLSSTFPFGDRVDRQLRPQFRLVEAGEYRRNFASDRSHMKNADGSWKNPPPSWPAIQAPGQRMNLDEFVDMQPSGFGEVLSLPILKTRFGLFDHASEPAEASAEADE